MKRWEIKEKNHHSNSWKKWIGRIQKNSIPSNTQRIKNFGAIYELQIFNALNIFQFFDALRINNFSTLMIGHRFEKAETNALI